MKSIFDLNIDRLEDIFPILDELILKHKLITGYNKYLQLPNKNTLSLCFSNIYGGKDYENDMIKSLKKIKYSTKNIEKYIREKRSVYKWDYEWSLVDEEDNIKSDLKIRKFDPKKFVPIENIDLEEWVCEFGFKSLYKSNFYKKDDLFIAEDKSLEINLPVKNTIILEDLIYLFVNNYSTKLFDNNGKEIAKKRNHWSGAWDTPVLIIEGNSGEYEKILNDNNFSNLNRAVKVFKKENNNEISFIIGKKYEKLLKSDFNTKLNNLNFETNFCLVNKPFLLYINKKSL